MAVETQVSIFPGFNISRCHWNILGDPHKLLPSTESRFLETKQNDRKRQIQI